MKNFNVNVNNIKDDESLVLKGSLTGYATIDKPWLKYYPEGIDKFNIPEMSMYQLLEESVKDIHNKTAIRYFDFKINYNQYLKRINKYAKSLKAMGIKEDDIVLLSLPNVPESRMIIYGLNIIGATAYPVTPMLPPKEFERIVDENHVNNIFMFDLFYKKYQNTLMNNKNIKNIVTLNGEEAIPRLVQNIKKIKEKVQGNKKTQVPFSIKNIKWEDFLKKGKSIKDNIEPLYKPNHTAVIIGTSGTTGTPKGVCLTNESLNAMALQHKYGDMNFEKGDRLLDVLIQSIGYGISVAHYSGICGLETIVVPQLATDISPFIEKYHPDHFTGGPIHYENLEKKYKVENLPYAKNMVSGGASLEKGLETKINSIFDNCLVESDLSGKVFVRQGLGCTENGGAATYAKKGTYKFGGVGIPLAFENMGIFKPGTDEELKYGELGEICITGPTMMNCYLNRPEETSKVIKKHKDGKLWLHTCDLGKVDEDGQFYITDRIKDIFMRKGFNVHPSKISDFISDLEDVELCKVIGVAHPEEQTVPVAFVKVDSDKSIEKIKNNIYQKCTEELEETSIPYEIIFVDEMPINIGGKIDSNYLMELSGIDYNKESAKQDNPKIIKTKRQF